MEPIDLKGFIKSELVKQFIAEGVEESHAIDTVNSYDEFEVFDKYIPIMLEFGKLLLERAADNAELNETSHGEGGYITTYTLNRDSITSVINEVKH